MLPELQAERQLALIEAVSIPHMDQHAQRNTLRKYNRALNADVPAARATNNDMAAIGIPVVEFRAEEG